MADCELTPSVTHTFRGSCHCGFVKYLVNIDLPPVLKQDTLLSTPASGQPTTRIRKCNCSSCLKMGNFQILLHEPSRDFALLSPLDPLTELGDYLVFDKMIHWLYCKRCAVRCFSFYYGTGNIIEKEIDGKITKVWTLAETLTVQNDVRGSLSVNAHTLDPGQEGLDLREWHEKKWICYLDSVHYESEGRFDRPHEGGVY